jgi:hypothetical protein
VVEKLAVIDPVRPAEDVPVPGCPLNVTVPAIGVVPSKNAIVPVGAAPTKTLVKMVDPKKTWLPDRMEPERLGMDACVGAGVTVRA